MSGTDLWRFDPLVADYPGYYDRLRQQVGVRHDGRFVDENLLADLILLLMDIERGEHLK